MTGRYPKFKRSCKDITGGFPFVLVIVEELETPGPSEVHRPVLNSCCAGGLGHLDPCRNCHATSDARFSGLVFDRNDVHFEVPVTSAFDRSGSFLSSVRVFNQALSSLTELGT